MPTILKSTVAAAILSLTLTLAGCPKKAEEISGGGGDGASAGHSSGGTGGAGGGTAGSGAQGASGGAGGAGGAGGTAFGPGTLHEDLTFEHDGETRTYHFYEAGGHELVDRPLVFVLHGAGGTIDNQIGDWPHRIWLDIADEESVHIVVPQGIGGHWQDCRTDAANIGDEDDIGFLVGLLAELSANYGVDADRVYAVGESNGGMMALRLAEERPDLFDAIGAVIALMPENNGCTPMNQPISVMFQVGTADALIPYAGGPSGTAAVGSFLSAADSVDHWRTINQCPSTPVHTDIPDGPHDDESTASLDAYTCDATSTSVAIYTFDGAGHVPPSIVVQVGALWEAIVGMQNHDVEGARAFWDFFETHSGS